jgi:hypothetical protein
VTVGAGTFKNVIAILESSQLNPDTETKWYAPGVGVIKGKFGSEKFALILSTLRSP